MAKEISLEELTSSANSNRKVVAANVINSNSVPTKKEGNSNPNQTLKNAKLANISELGAKLAEKHPGEKESNESPNDAPMVADAFKAMYKTVNERKQFFEEEVLPVVKANREEMELEAEMGISPEEGLRMKEAEDAKEQEVNKIEEVSAIPDVDDSDFDILDEDDEKSEDEESIDAVPEAKSYNVEQPKTNIPITYTDGQEPKVRAAMEKPKAVKEEKPAKKPATVKEEDNDLADLDNFMDELDQISADEADEEETAEEIRERFKETLNSVKVTRNPIDLTKFTIRKNAISSSAALANINSVDNLKKADWGLYYTGRSMTFTECKGPELESLRKTINNSNGVNGVIASLRFIYNHVVDANKPAFEAWTKLIRTEDIESLYFGIYRACYSDSNLVARACVKDETTGKGCNKTSLIDTPIKDMVKYKDDETKAKFEDIFRKDSTSSDHTFESTLLQISDDIVISYSTPSIYSTFIQFASLKPEITEKYSETLNTMAYIDGFFTIDRATNELVPMAVKEYPNNLNKTILSKLKVYTEILKTLTNDQYNVLISKLNNLIDGSAVTYVYPKTTCPECGSTIDEEPVDSVLNLLFTRAQLVQVKSL